ncbi:anti-sigma factor [Orenia metallireducens]|uniref:Anti-sigma factor n=1 Tax=Orenia metallireducens TaxID=1413210 RepID=A0A1C0AAV1_9FIRM|nr:anti-sigma factor [Orenia metallireducens]
MTLITTSCGASYERKEVALNSAIQPRTSLSYDKAEVMEESKVMKSVEVETPTVERKIIRNANLNLEIRDLSNISEKVNKIINSHQGFIANSRKWTGYNNRKFYNFTLRVPEEEFEVTLSELSQLGKLLREELSGQDITKEYIDIQARLNNFKAQEERYLELLDKAKDVKDILEVERELNRVRINIEQLEGTIKYYDNQISLATIRVNISEPEAIINNSSNLGFLKSFREALRSFIKSINLIIVLIGALIPWLILVAILGYLLYRIIKKRRS